MRIQLFKQLWMDETALYPPFKVYVERQSGDVQKCAAHVFIKGFK